jgi:hypothetical protein
MQQAPTGWWALPMVSLASLPLFETHIRLPARLVKQLDR